MGDFPLASCAFAGFRLLARRPLMLLAWWLGVLVLCAVVMGGGLLISGTSQPASFVIRLLGLGGGPVLWLTATVLACGVFRQSLRDERHLIGLRLGPDELRQAPLVLVFVAILAGGLLLSGKARLAVTAGLLLVSPFVCLIPPAIFAARRLGPGEGWRLRKGRYFDLLAMNLLTWGVYATASVLLGKLRHWLIVLNDASIQRAMHQGSGAVGWLLAPAVVLAVLVYGALLVIVAAPSAEAYRRLTSPPAPGP